MVTMRKLCSIVRIKGARKGERLGKDVLLVFQYAPGRMEYLPGYTVTVIQSVPVPTV